ncbi:MAG: TonB-dependent receptor domain-containing protein, partial [bacterium]
ALGGGVRYTGMTYGDQANTLEVPAHTLVDLNTHYSRDRMRLSLDVHNLFDKAYVASCYTAASCFYGTTRSVRATIRYRW